MVFSEDQTGAIGIFDSGLGGLTVVRAIRECIPNENLIFLGDIARVPYGTRSEETVRRYARTCANALHQLNIKILVVACNTVSAVALDMLREDFEFPVLGVIEPGARTAVAAAPGGQIGVIATRRTVASGGYIEAVRAVDSHARVTANPAPLLVPLAEEGWTDDEVAALVVQRYLEPLVAAEIDALVLGCTHYPLLSAVIEEQFYRMSGRRIPVVDSALATAHELRDYLERSNMMIRSNSSGRLQILVTDSPEKFCEVASRFLNEPVSLQDISQIDI